MDAARPYACVDHALAVLRMLGLAVALVFAMLAVLATNGIASELGARVFIPLWAPAAVPVAALLPFARNYRLAAIGVALFGLSTLNWVAGEAMVAYFGAEPWEDNSLGRFTPSTDGRWDALRWRVETLVWALLYGAALVTLFRARKRPVDARDRR